MASVPFSARRILTPGQCKSPWWVVVSSSLPLFSLLFFFSFPSLSLVFFPPPKRFHNTSPHRKTSCWNDFPERNKNGTGQRPGRRQLSCFLSSSSSSLLPRGVFYPRHAFTKGKRKMENYCWHACLLKLLFGNPKTREENNHFQLSTHPPCIIILLPMYQRKNPIKFGKISLFEKNFCFIPPTIPPNLANRQGPPRKRGFFRT